MSTTGYSYKARASTKRPVQTVVASTGDVYTVTTKWLGNGEGATTIYQIGIKDEARGLQITRRVRTASSLDAVIYRVVEESAITFGQIKVTP